jgi:hypothetical protein
MFKAITIAILAVASMSAFAADPVVTKDTKVVKKDGDMDMTPKEHKMMHKAHHKHHAMHKKVVVKTTEVKK